MNIELSNNLKELIRLGEAGQNPIPDVILDKLINNINELKACSNHLNYVMSDFFKYGRITNDISAPVMNDQIDLITVLNMRLECYEKLKQLYIQEKG